MTQAEERLREQREQAEAALVAYYEADAAEQEAITQATRAKSAKREALERLRGLGKPPAEIAELTGLSLADVRAYLRKPGQPKPDTAASKNHQEPGPEPEAELEPATRREP
jgi:hypothetical protein